MQLCWPKQKTNLFMKSKAGSWKLSQLGLGLGFWDICLFQSQGQVDGIFIYRFV
jgi:hypothetical protein